MLSICASLGTLGSDARGCTLKTVGLSFCIVTLGSDTGTDVVSISCVRSHISCSCFDVTTGLRFRTLARLAIAFMILLACDNNGFVMFLCLKWTVMDNRSLWVDLIWQVCV